MAASQAMKLPLNETRHFLPLMELSLLGFINFERNKLPSFFSCKSVVFSVISFPKVSGWLIKLWFYAAIPYIRDGTIPYARDANFLQLQTLCTKAISTVYFKNLTKLKWFLISIT